MSLLQEALKCRPAKGWDGHKTKIGNFFGWVKVRGRTWAIVQWDDEDDPDINKIEGLEVSTQNWIPAKGLSEE